MFLIREYDISIRIKGAYARRFRFNKNFYACFLDYQYIQAEVELVFVVNQKHYLTIL